jgi:hypothetical protein
LVGRSASSKRTTRLINSSSGINSYRQNCHQFFYPGRFPGTGTRSVVMRKMFCSLAKRPILRPPAPEGRPACMRAPARRASGHVDNHSAGTEPLLGLCYSGCNMYAPLLTSCIARIETEDQMSAIPNSYAAEIAGRFVHPI